MHINLYHSIPSPHESALFGNAFSQIKTSTKQLELCELLKEQKKEVKKLLYTHLGRSKEERKPTPLLQLEEGMKNYFFGVNGILTDKIPKLRNEYERQKNKRKLIYFTKGVNELKNPLLYNNSRNNSKDKRDSFMKTKHPKSKSFSQLIPTCTKSVSPSLEFLITSTTTNKFRTLNVKGIKNQNKNINNHSSSRIPTTLKHIQPLPQPLYRNYFQSSQTLRSSESKTFSTPNTTTLDSGRSILLTNQSSQNYLLHIGKNKSTKLFTNKSNFHSFEISKKQTKAKKKKMKLVDDIEYLKTIKNELNNLESAHLNIKMKCLNRNYYKDIKKMNELIGKFKSDKIIIDSTLDKNEYKQTDIRKRCPLPRHPTKYNREV